MTTHSFVEFDSLLDTIITEYLDNKLDTSTKTVLEQLISNESGLEKHLTSIRAIKHELNALPFIPAPTYLKHRILEASREEVPCECMEL